MSDWEFKASDFIDANLIHDRIMIPPGVTVECYSPQKVADLANAKLHEWLEKAPGGVCKPQSPNGSARLVAFPREAAPHPRRPPRRIKPIQRDTPEILLREILKEHDIGRPRKEWAELIERARKLVRE